ncbi:unnamed protein product [Mucor circinelloides]
MVCSRSSADAGNRCRSLSDAGRQHSGRKMDYLFTTKQIEYEIGCGECALVGGVNTTKEFQDAGFKMPKVMRDMLFKIVLAFPALLHQVPICGFYIAHNCLTLYVLDSPVGYVTRYDAFNSVQYPLVESMIRGRLALLLPMVYKARLIMENCKDALYNDESFIDFGLGKNHPVLMEPSFVSVSVNIKKRRQE